MWNPSNCECECDKSCNIREYLDYENCICRKTIIDRLIEECTNTIEENNDILIISSNNTIYFNLFIVFSLLFLVISSIFVYFYWFKKSCRVKFNPKTMVTDL